MSNVNLLLASHNGRRGDFKPNISLVRYCNNDRASEEFVKAKDIEVEGINNDIRVMGLTTQSGRLVAIAGSDDAGYLATFDTQFNQTSWQRLPNMADPHGIVFEGDSFFVVSSRTNEVVRYTWNAGHPVFKEVVFRVNGEKLHHLNGLAMHKGKLIVSAMGGPAQDAHDFVNRGYIFDVFGKRTLMDGLDHPHSLISHNENLLFCESRTATIYKNASKFGKLSGYLRGMAIDPVSERIFVGSSSARPPRNQPIGNRPNAKIWVLNFGGNVIGAIELIGIGPEIHELLLFP